MFPPNFFRHEVFLIVRIREASLITLLIGLRRKPFSSLATHLLASACNAINVTFMWRLKTSLNPLLSKVE